MTPSNKFFAALLPVFAFFSCSTDETTDVPVVSVGDKVLTVTTLRAAIPSSISAEDSAVMADDFIRRWTFEQVLLKKAELNLIDNELDIATAIEDYKRSLIIERYQQKMVEQKFRPELSDSDIVAYYTEMQENFKLNENILKGFYAIIPKNAPDYKSFKTTLLRHDNEDSFIDIEKYLFKHSVKYELFFDKWMPVSTVKNHFPANIISNEVQILKSHNRLYEMQDDNNYYLLMATDHHFADEVAPIEYVRDKISTILLNKKKISFIKSLNKKLYDEAMKNDMIKFYDLK